MNDVQKAVEQRLKEVDVGSLLKREFFVGMVSGEVRTGPGIYESCRVHIQVVLALGGKQLALQNDIMVARQEWLLSKSSNWLDMMLARYLESTIMQFHHFIDQERRAQLGNSPVDMDARAKRVQGTIYDAFNPDSVRRRQSKLQELLTAVENGPAVMGFAERVMKHATHPNDPPPSMTVSRSMAETFAKLQRMMDSGKSFVEAARELGIKNPDPNMPLHFTSEYQQDKPIIVGE